jgi:succinoglycan biosynthesis transport protein ExoP
LNNSPQEQLGRNIIHEFVRIARKSNRLILAGTIIGLLVALTVVILMRPVYSASTTIQVEKENNGLDLGDLSGLGASLGSDDLKVTMKTHEENLKGDSTAIAVINDQHLVDRYPYRTKKPLLSWKAGERVETLENSPSFRDRCLQIFKSNLEVKEVSGSRLITVAFSDPDPLVARDVANSIVAAYIDQSLAVKYSATAKASSWLAGQLSDLKLQVETSQNSLAEYQRQSGLIGSFSPVATDKGDQSNIDFSANPVVGKLTILNTELAQAETNRLTKEAIYRFSQSEKPDVVLDLATSLSSVGGSGGGSGKTDELADLRQLRQQQTVLQVSEADAATKYGIRNPALIEIQNQLKALSQKMQEEMDRVRARAKNDFILAQKQESDLRKEYDAQKEEVGRLNDSATHLELLAVDAESSRALYQALYSKLQEANVEAGVKATNILTIEPARTPSRPTKPRPLPYLAIGLMVGCIVGLGLGFLRESFSDVVTIPAEVEAHTSFPALAAIPLFEANSKGAGDHIAKSILLSKPHDPASEAFRQLRTSLLLRRADKPAQILLVTSPLPNDGKTTITFNLANAFALQGSRVLLIDGDMRKGKLQQLLELKGRAGLSSILSGNTNLESTTVPSADTPNLHFLGSGPIPPLSTELLGSASFGALLKEARSKYDYIFIDSPPLLLVADPMVISEHVDGVLAVVRSGKTKLAVLRRTDELLLRNVPNVFGYVVNALDSSTGDYYYAYGYYGRTYGEYKDS